MTLGVENRRVRGTVSSRGCEGQRHRVAREAALTGCCVPSPRPGGASGTLSPDAPGASSAERVELGRSGRVPAVGLAGEI